MVVVEDVLVVDEEVVVDVAGTLVVVGAGVVVVCWVEVVVSAEPPPQEAAIRATTRASLRIGPSLGRCSRCGTRRIAEGWPRGPAP